MSASIYAACMTIAVSACKRGKPSTVAMSSKNYRLTAATKIAIAVVKDKNLLTATEATDLLHPSPEAMAVTKVSL